MKPTDLEDNVLERNVTTLIESGGEPPRIAGAARTRIRAELIAKHGVAEHRSRWRSPRVAVGLGLAATAAAALIVTQLVGGGEAVRKDGALADGTTWITEPGAKVEQLGPRRVRVTGAALLDVAPGQGTFVVETARGRIEVLGTRFLVDAEADRTTAAVVRGSVKLASADGDVVLHAGEQGVAEPGRPPSRGPAPRLSHLVSWAAHARKRDEHAVQPLRNGTLFAKEPNNPHVPESPLPIAKLTVDVVVEDQVARVALDQTFHNPATTVMEGHYRFAIPPDAALQRLAMYVGGELMESGVVERMAARRIYEDIVYRRLDPALLEWAGTGRLALRVYPLPPREDKRLLLAYTQSLPKLYDDWTLSVPLPEVDLPVGELAFDVKVAGCANCEITSPSHAIRVTRAGEDATVAYRGNGVKLGDSLVLRVRDPRQQAIVATHAAGGNEYLLVRARPELPRAARAYRPRTWVILDDVSASRGPLELRAQAELIDGFLRELDEDDRVAVIAFDVAARHKLGLTRVDDVDRRAVRRSLADEGGVGATNFATALAEATKLLAGVPAGDARVVYLGDGVITTGAKNLDALRTELAGKAQFIGVGIGDGPDIETLQALASATGGYATTIDLADDVGWRAFDLIAALHTSRVTGLEAKLVDADGAVVPVTGYLAAAQLADGEELELVARLAGGAPPVAAILTGTLDGAAWQQRVDLGKARRDAGYLPRLWAQRHIAARMLEKHTAVIVPPCTEVSTAATKRRAATASTCATEAEVRAQRDEAIRKEVVALGKQYFVLSRHTSLLVLENDAMYAKYGVTKGRGDTWAPYRVPAKITVKPWVATGTPADVADDAVLVRSPLRVFYDQGYSDQGFGVGHGRWGGRITRGDWNRQQQLGTIGHGSGGGGVFSSRGALGLGVTGPRQAGVAARASAEQLDGDRAGVSFSGATSMENEYLIDGVETTVAREPAGGGLREDKLDLVVDSKKRQVSTGEILGGLIGGDLQGTGRFERRSASASQQAGWASLLPAPSWPAGGALIAQRMTYPTDTAYDDLTAFIPALFPDASDALRGALEAAAAGAKQHPIDDAARAQLAAARRALPAGVYRWGDAQIAVDGARRLGWRRTTPADLAETASFDGTTWLRRYAELGVDVHRALAEDDVALALAHLPLWIAEPAHYARWFEVRLQAPREVTLWRAPAVKGAKAELAYTLVFDDRHRLVALRDGAGEDLLSVTWDASGPTAARLGGQQLDVGFTAQPLTDAVAWAHGASQPGVVVEQPGHLPAYWAARVAALAAGSAEWRHAQRQRMVSLAAMNDRATLFATYEALRGNGGVALGDLVLASGGVATASTNAQLATALAPHAGTPVARYLAAARAYGKAPTPDRLKAEVQAGFVGALWTLREATALLVAQRGTQAVDRLLGLGERALELRLIGAAATSVHYQTKPADVVRAWDAVATGAYRNTARVQAAQALASRGAHDAAAERTAALILDLDLRAAPPSLENLRWQFQSSRRGSAGWQLVWAMWRDKALASTSYEHVLALLPAASEHPADVPAILARAAALADGDVARVVLVARLATAHGQAALAQGLVDPVVKAHPTRELHQLAGELALQQGRPADALAHLEAAQVVAEPDEAISVSTVRTELGQILQVLRQLAVQTSGAPRQALVARARTWASRWRAIDPGNPQIDIQLGDFMLAVGELAEAWRQLSTVIERDPLGGEGYQLVAEAFERQGRVTEAIAYWHQAVILDQTNPTHRLREAQALIAVGRSAEGDALLAEIAGRRWHERWSSVAWQAKWMIERGRQGTK